jgi:hypothetical protein
MTEGGGGIVSDQFAAKLAADQRGGALQRFDSHIALVGIEDAVDLGAAGVYQLGEALFADALFRPCG